MRGKKDRQTEEQRARDMCGGGGCGRGQTEKKRDGGTFLSRSAKWATAD